MHTTVEPIRQELLDCLNRTDGLLQALIALARSETTPPADLIAYVDRIERLDDERDELIKRLQREVSGQRRRQLASKTSLPRLVVSALQELRWPQNTGFVGDYLWARHNVRLDTRAVAPLRRDERRAWERRPEDGRAYLAPALGPDGAAVTRWLTVSTWPLERRIIASRDTETLLDLQKVRQVADQIDQLRQTAADGPPLHGLLERLAHDQLEFEPPAPDAAPEERDAWRRRVRSQANRRIGEVRSRDEPHRARLAGELSELSEAERLWGRAAGRRPSRAAH